MASSTDSALDNLAEETAKEVAVESGELSDELHGTLSNADGDPCNSYEWSVIFILVFVVSYVLMGVHSWLLIKRRASLTAIDVLSIALFLSTIVQFGPMMSQVSEWTGLAAVSGGASVAAARNLELLAAARPVQLGPGLTAPRSLFRRLARESGRRLITSRFQSLCVLDGMRAH